jgi:hypothetical protein
MSVRFPGILLATSFIGLMSSHVPPGAFAAASQISCGKPELRAEGRRSDPGSPEYKEQVARALSVSKWEQLARELYGSPFADWLLAREPRIECEHYAEQGLNGRVSCVAIGLPCDKP